MDAISLDLPMGAPGVELLQRVKDECMAAVQREYEFMPRDVMIFANYPPSVFSLHFHVCCPFKAAAPFDAFRMHTLESIIHNLKVDSEYSTRYSLHIPVSYCSRLYHALVGSPPPTFPPTAPSRRNTCVFGNAR